MTHMPFSYNKSNNREFITFNLVLRAKGLICQMTEKHSAPSCVGLLQPISSNGRGYKCDGYQQNTIVGLVALKLPQN